MTEPTEFQSKRAEKLASRGYQALADGEYDEAIDIGRELEELRYSAAFEISAQANAALGDLDAAVEILERGVSLAPTVWVNWQLLGNYRSDLEKYDEAEEAYRTALTCPRVWVESVRLNQAILMNRRDQHADALDVLETIDDSDLRPFVLASRMRALYAMGRLDEAAETFDEFLEEADELPDNSTLADVAALRERIRLDQGESPFAVRRRIALFLLSDPGNSSVLTLIRDTYSLHSPHSQYLRILVHWRADDGSPKGYFVTYDVVADGSEDAIRFIREIQLIDERHELLVEEVQVVEETTADPKGVYWYSGPAYYEEDD